MIGINDFTIIVAVLSFIAVLIILAKINNQLDKFVLLLIFIKTRIQEIDEYIKWNIDIIRKELEKKEKGQNEIKWIDEELKREK